jgi:response regulator RpfG family c-di-GMP phosphodiesterase
MANNRLLVDTRLLRRDGYTLFRATNHEEGLKLLADNDIGVIVSDQRMPQMTGVEFLTRARETRPDTVRIALSGYTDLDSVIFRYIPRVNWGPDGSVILDKKDH